MEALIPTRFLSVPLYNALPNLFDLSLLVNPIPCTSYRPSLFFKLNFAKNGIAQSHGTGIRMACL